MCFRTRQESKGPVRVTTPQAPSSLTLTDSLVFLRSFFLKFLFRLLISYIKSWNLSCEAQILWICSHAFPLRTVTPSALRKAGRIYPVPLKKIKIISSEFQTSSNFGWTHLLLSAHREVLLSYLFFECTVQSCHAFFKECQQVSANMCQYGKTHDS